MKKKLKLQLSKKPTNALLHKYIYEHWYAPQDAMQRALEASLWQDVVFKEPTLDIGVGDGSVSKYIFAKHKKISIGIDLNPEGLDKAKKTGVYKKILQADAANLPFLNSSFNTVVSNSTFEHIALDEKAIKEVSRVLKKSGLFLMTVPSVYFEQMIKEFESSSPGKAVEEANTRLSHFHYRSLSQWSKIFSKNKMKIIYHQYYLPRKTFKLWYYLFKFSTKKIHSREIWSYLAHSKFSKLIPQKLIKPIIYSFLEPYFSIGLYSDKDLGAQIFIVAQKIS